MTRVRSVPSGLPAMTPVETGNDRRTIELAFDDNRLLPLLFGEHDSNLARIEQALGLTLISRGNRLAIKGEAQAAETARLALHTLWEEVQRGETPGPGAIDAALRLARGAGGHQGNPPAPGASQVLTFPRGKRVAPRSPTQAAMLGAMERSPIVFAIGPAGTGKTYLAVAKAVAMLQAGAVDRLVISRPAVEAGERLGFLPGDLQEKIDPYLRPIYDALHDLMPGDQVMRRQANGEIEIAPLAFMRGRTLAHAFVILDEAQNTTSMQMKMALTRLGEGSQLVVTGDIGQIDLPPGQPSGLVEACSILDGIDGIEMIRFNTDDVVRHPLVARIVNAYDRHASARRPDATGTRARRSPRRNPAGTDDG